VRANSFRTQQAIAQFGKSARYPVCQAWLGIRVLDAELKGAVQFEETINSAKELKKQDRALLDLFYKEGKQREAIRAAALVCKIDKFLRKLEAPAYRQVAANVRSTYQELRRVHVARFEREREAVDRAKDVKARRALQRVKKRWSANANGARLKDGDRRTLEILKLLRDKCIKATGAKSGNAAYIEAARGGDRLLSDEFWSGRLTVREIHSHLLRIGGSRLAGDKDAKEIRRLARKLKIRLAEDQRGRKRKPYMAEHEPKRPLGRPRIKPGVSFTGDVEAIQGREVAAARGKIPVRHG